MTPKQDTHIPEQAASEVVTQALVDRFLATFNIAERLNTDAPRMIHLCLAPEIVPTSALAPDGHGPRGTFLPKIDLPRRMWAGSKITFDDEIGVGDDVQRTSRVVQVTHKTGKSGPLCFVDVAHAYSADGQCAVRETQTIVYRSAETPTPQTSASIEAPRAEVSQKVPVTNALLFRYSALTFNAHRIHYDLAYANDVERYSDLVVHGPLQATVLYQFAAQVGGQNPDRFEYRNLAPFIGAQDPMLCAKNENDRIALWVARSDGVISMRGRARWTE